MSYKFLNLFGEFSYQSIDEMIERYHFLCWWISFLDISRNPYYESAKDRSEHKILKDYLGLKHPDRVFNPKSVFDTL